MERMTKIDENIQTAQNLLSGIVERCYELEEENKKLKEKLSEITMVADDEKQSIEHILELEEENKKLKEELDKANKLVDKLNEQVRVLIFEREIRLATMREMRKKMRDMIK